MSSLIIDNIINNEVSNDSVIFNDYDTIITIIFDKYNYHSSFDDLSKQLNLGIYENENQYVISSAFFVYSNNHNTIDRILFDLSNNLFNIINDNETIMNHIKNRKTCIKVITNIQNSNSLEVKYNFRFYVPLTIKLVWETVFSNSIPVFMVYNK